MKLLITGAAGFIATNLILEILDKRKNWEITGVDAFIPTDLFTANLMASRLNECGIDTKETQRNKSTISKTYSKYKFNHLDLKETDAVKTLFKENEFDICIHLAAITGVRESILYPQKYIDNNITGFNNLISEAADKIKYMIYASSSSVYGFNDKLPYEEDDKLFPKNIYALTKYNKEVLANIYEHYTTLRSIGLRFFTVYGEWGRPDMSYFKWTKQILNKTPIEIYNYGEMLRDYTYIKDIVTGIIKIVDAPLPSKNNIYNMGSEKPLQIINVVKILEQILNTKATINYKPINNGEMRSTYSNTNKFKSTFNHSFNTPLTEGLNNFINWYCKQYAI